MDIEKIDVLYYLTSSIMLAEYIDSHIFINNSNHYSI